MKETTLCYLEKDGCYLMLHRTKKQQDENAGKWIGVGGHIEEDETPEDCLVREVREETGLTLTGYRARGVVEFSSDEWGEERMHLFTSDDFEGEVTACDEGELKWIPVEQVPSLPLWEGDRIFLQLLTQDVPFFILSLEYQGQELVSSKISWMD